MPARRRQSRKLLIYRGRENENFLRKSVTADPLPRDRARWSNSAQQHLDFTTDFGIGVVENFRAPFSGGVEQIFDLAPAVTGSFLNSAVKGFWNPSTKRLVFYRAVSGTTASTPAEEIQIFSGYMFPENASYPNGLQLLAGEFQFFAGTGGTSPVNILGWYAVHAASL